MIRITSAKTVADVMAVLHSLGAAFHLGDSRSVIVITPEDFKRCIDAAREGVTRGAVDFLTDEDRPTLPPEMLPRSPGAEVVVVCPVCKTEWHADLAANAVVLAQIAATRLAE